MSPYSSNSAVLDVGQVADLLACSKSLVYDLVSDGLLKPFRMRDRTVFKAADIQAYIGTLPSAALSVGDTSSKRAQSLRKWRERQKETKA